MRMPTWNKAAGRKPTKELLAAASQFARSGTADHVVVAMALRPDGVTQNEVVALFDHPHRNKIKKLVEDKKFKLIQLPDGSRASRIRLVPRGTQHNKR